MTDSISKSKLSMVIPCYFENDMLIEMTIRCLNSLNNTTDDEPSEVLVIDDGSPLELEDDTNFVQEIKVLRREANGGYAGAVNMGLFHATGDVIIVCNNDVVFIQPDWLKHLLKPLQEGYDISSIRTSDSDGWTTDDKITEGDKFGSIWAMKREVYETIGGLDESFGKGYFEDLDYQKSAEDAGFKVGKNHAGLVEHIGKATFSVTDPADTAYKKAMEKFKEKHGKIW